MKKKSLTQIEVLILLLFSTGFLQLYSQSLTGTYGGILGQKESYIELKETNGFIVGLVHSTQESKWFFTATLLSANFEGYSTVGLDYDAIIKGSISGSTLRITIVSRDSTFEGNYKKIDKAKLSAALKQKIENSQSFIDLNLIGEWVCIGEIAPQEYMDINWKRIWKSDGTVIPDIEYAKEKFKRIYAKHTLHRNPSDPNISARGTWKSRGGYLFESYSSQFGEEELIYSYEIKNDTLRLINSKNYISILVRNKSRD
jgi:hypothetical protein